MFYIMIEMCEMLNKITVWQILTIFFDEQFSPMRGQPFTRNVRNAEQDNRVADFDNFCDEQISRMRGHPLKTTLLTHYGTLHNQET